MILPDFWRRFWEGCLLNKKKAKRNTVVRRQPSARPVERVKAVFLVALPVLFIAAAGYLTVVSVRSSFVLNKVLFTGNVHLPDEDLKNLAGLKSGENLLTLSGGTIYRKISASPWIRYAAVRKEFPDTLHILVRETEPLALLEMKGRLFIVDEKGKMLEELRESSMPFLPIISGDPYGEKEVFSEAIQLVRTIKETGLLSGKNHVEIIAHRLQEIALNIDGTVVKIGAGEYADKLTRLVELEQEIKGRSIPVDYIDLRFANRVVVKPVNEVVR
jgi:cell division protein FtsQ